MTKTKPFDKYASQYDDWFERNKLAFESELQAIRGQLPKSNNGIEIGVGSGQFAVPLGIKIGIDPSKNMREIAQKRGINVINGVAEDKPILTTDLSGKLRLIRSNRKLSAYVWNGTDWTLILKSKKSLPSKKLPGICNLMIFI